jgi:hypothetical protein
MTQALPISSLINVGVNLSPAAAQAQNLSTLLILTSDNVIDTNQRLRTYNSLAGVAADFGTNSVGYAAALLYFAQTPQPSQLMLGRWAKIATAGLLVGGALTAANQAIAPWNAVTSPAFFVKIDGVPYAIAPASFATATNLNGVASLIATALTAASTGAGCTFFSNGEYFNINSGSTGAASSVSFLQAPTAVGKITFAGQPSNNDTITLGGTVVTFVTGTPSGNQVKIGATLAATLTALQTFLQASVDTNLVKFQYFATATILYLSAAAAGTAGNSLTIAASVATPSGTTLAGATGTDISGMLNMTNTAGDGAYAANGVAAESALSAVTLFDTNFGQTWYAICVPEGADADALAIGPYIEAANNKHIFGVTTQEAGALSSVSTTDLAYLLNQLGLTRTLTQYSSSSVYAVISYLAKAISVNYAGNSTVLTMMYKGEPVVVAETLTPTQAAALLAKGCNVFVNYNNSTAIVQYGIMSKGNNLYTDEITFIDWLAVNIMTALYNLLYTSTTKIPQTDSGVQLLVNAAEAIAVQGVVNGGIAPGVWNANGFGTLKQGDFLPKGFYTYAQSVNLQNQANRVARQSPPIQMAVKLAGAIHTVAFTINVNQ